MLIMFILIIFFFSFILPDIRTSWNFIVYGASEVTFISIQEEKDENLIFIRNPLSDWA